jgi:hypothetical protein
MLGDFLVTVVWLFFWTMALWIFISVFSDIFRREDMSGGMKAVWIVVIFIIPFVGCLIYLIARPKMTAQDVRGLAQAEAAQKAVSGVSTADELTKLTQLKDAGVISVPQYEQLKAKLLADAGAPAAPAAAAPATPAAPAG